MRKAILIFCFLWGCLLSTGQDIDFAKVFLRNIDGGYLGQHADNSKDKSGTGIQSIGGGGIYIGDINRNKFNGKGMLIAGPKGKISNLPDAYVYVGGFIKGKKHGSGTVYAPNGDVIYKGRFEDDKPLSAYPQPNPDESKYFSMMELDGGIYLGEVQNGVPHGFGICVDNGGYYWIGNSREGERKGLSILIYDTNTWEAVNYDGNGYTVINNSQQADARNSQIHQVNKQIWNETFTGLMDCAENLVRIGAEYSAAKNSSGTSGEVYSENSTGSGSKSKGGKAGAANKKGNDCGTAWQTASRTYSDYETQLVPNGARTATDPSQRAQIRSKMRSLRQKWEARGCTITKSPYEDG